ncbi:hypothetical protein IW147_005102 [Coemansia sp. RSA 720]|nr:hypothetical protein IW147_005102 [Coemansia sp. RSA 720]
MEGNNSLRELRRFEIDNDTDLEALQQEFFNSNSKPAATLVSRGQAPPVVGSVQSKTQSTSTKPAKDDKPNMPSGGDVFAFAKNMAEAIKEFEIKEKSTVMHPVKDAPVTESVVPGKAKKLSLFAQRRLAKQKQGGGDAGVSNAAGPSVGGTSSAATFLPKLMAPVTEHTSADPAQPPQLKSRESGFPEIPVDVAATQSVGDSRAASTAEEAAQVDPQNTDYWTSIRSQVSQENQDRVKNMTEAEILEAQDEIRSAVSSETLQRILQRKNKTNTSETHKAPTPKDDKPPKQVRFAETDDVSDIPPPPPQAEWVDDESATSDPQRVNVDDNSTGADSEFYQETKRRLFPSEMVEDAQLAWMMGHNQAKSPMEQAVSESRQRNAQAAAQASSSSDSGLLERAASKVRFAFDGQIMGEEQSDIPTSAGLHHHGDDPEKPGYTIPELLHLSRSTVPAQRSVAMATLGNIIHKVNTGVWDPAQAAQVYTGLLDWQAELYFVHGILDTNKTSRAKSVISLWTWVVEMTRYKALVRLATGGDLEPANPELPGVDIKMTADPVSVKGVLIERTFAALDSMLSTKFMDAVYENISMSLMPEQQLTMLAECIKTLADMSNEFDDRIKAHSRLPVLLQNKYPYLMNKP